MPPIYPDDIAAFLFGRPVRVLPTDPQPKHAMLCSVPECQWPVHGWAGQRGLCAVHWAERDGEKDGLK